MPALLARAPEAASANRVIHRLRRISSLEWQDDDAGEKSAWDHWKREMQGEHSFVHELLEVMVEAEAWKVIEALSYEEQQLLMFDTSAFHEVDDVDELRELHVDMTLILRCLMEKVNQRANDEPHRPQVQRLLDAVARDRWERDNEGQF